MSYRVFVMSTYSTSLVTGLLVVLALSPVAVSSLAIDPAVDVVSSDSPAKASLFDYETKQLTDQVVGRIASTPSTAQYANSFRFGDQGGGDTRDVERQQEACRAFPGDESWPEDSLWDTLDALTDGALIPTVPLAAPCYQNWGRYDSEKCSAIIRDFTNPDLQYAYCP